MTKLYTYKVEILVNVFADSEEESQTLLEQNNGVMTKRKATLIDTREIYNSLD